MQSKAIETLQPYEGWSGIRGSGLHLLNYVLSFFHIPSLLNAFLLVHITWFIGAENRPHCM
jgi:hypothetical protein